MTTAALLVAAALVVAAGLLRAAGASLVRTPRADALQDAAEGDERAARVAQLLQARPTLQPALGLAHAGLMVVAATAATWALTRTTTGWGLLVSLVLLGLLLLAVGDILPRGYGRGHPRKLAYRWVFLLEPAVRFGRAASDLISDENGEDDEAADEDDEDDEAERELISSVIEVGDTIVREVMVPRPDMVTLPSTATADQAVALSVEAGRSRIPVLGQGIDDVVGVLFIRDLLPLFDDEGGGDRPIADLVRPAFIVPEAMPVLDLMREMQNDRDHLAIVVDEFGGTAGLVTMEDLLEEIVGEITDESDEETPLITAVGEGEYLIDGRVGVDELEDLIGIEVPDEDWDTVGGLLLGLAGRVPEAGESFEFEGNVLTAEQVLGRRIAQVRRPHQMTPGPGTDDASVTPLRSGFVAVVGRPNVGKSTLVNALVGSKVSITSSRPQTTRNSVRGVANLAEPPAQIVLVDTPGLHRPRTALGTRLNRLVEDSLADTDLVAVPPRRHPEDRAGRPDAGRPARRRRRSHRPRGGQDGPGQAGAGGRTAGRGVVVGLRRLRPAVVGHRGRPRCAPRRDRRQAARGPRLLPSGHGHRPARRAARRRDGA